MVSADMLYSAQDRSDLRGIARVLYPHDGLGDSPYERVVSSLEQRSSSEPAVYKVLQAGLVDLRVNSGARLSDLDQDALHRMLLECEETEFFSLIRRLVAWYLYDDREVWAFVGYPGSSFEFGGYINRGFDDLAWLPDPRIEEVDDSLPDIGALLDTEIPQ